MPSLLKCLSHLSFHSLYNELSEQSMLQLSLNQNKFLIKGKLGRWMSKFTLNVVKEFVTKFWQQTLEHRVRDSIAPKKTLIFN